MACRHQSAKLVNVGSNPTHDSEVNMKICSTCHVEYYDAVTTCVNCSPHNREHKLLTLEEANKSIKFTCLNCGLDQFQNEACFCIRCSEQKIVSSTIANCRGYLWKMFLDKKWILANQKYLDILSSQVIPSIIQRVI